MLINLNSVKTYNGKLRIYFAVNFLIILLSLTVKNLYGQKKLAPQPLIIQGQLINCPEKYLNIGFDDKNGERVIDSIPVDKDGRFYLKTYKITYPQRASIYRNSTQINDFFVAPGYNLTITGDAKDFVTLFKTTNITGIGAESNNYRTFLNAMLAKTMNDKPWYQMNENELLAFIKQERKLKDSVAYIVFDKITNNDSYRVNLGKDKYLAYFKNMVRLDNEFVSLYYLLAHVNQHPKQYDSYDKIVAFIRNHADNDLLNHISKEEYLISKDYKNWIINGEYTNYMINLDYLRDSTLRKKKGYRLIAINKIYTGKVKEFVLYNQMSNDIVFSKTFDRLNYCKEMFKPYVEAFVNPFYRKSINEKYIAKEGELIKTLTGKPAPLFTLENAAGEKFSLADFKGKVVYLDLWASWCGPCREETPAFKKLFAKYKEDNRIAFISIAVSDGMAEWKRALTEDKPNWLQLLDKDGVVNKAYVANMIPKFIVIDKKGNIVSFDAPRPSEGKILENLLSNEMAK